MGGDVAAHTDESTENIAALVNAANDAIGTSVYLNDALLYEAYVRLAADPQAMRGKLAKRLRTDPPIAYGRADICRADLLVELEALGRPVSWSG